MIDELRNFDKDRTTLEELVALAAFGESYRATFEKLSVDVPDWVSAQLKVVLREIHSRQADQIDAALIKAKQKLASMATTEEKRAALQEQIKILEARQGGGA